MYGYCQVISVFDIIVYNTPKNAVTCIQICQRMRYTPENAGDTLGLDCPQASVSEGRANEQLNAICRIALPLSIGMWHINQVF